MTAMRAPEIIEAEIDLADLETAVAFIGPAGAFDAKNRATCEEFVRKVGDAMAAGHRIAVVGRGAKRMPPEDRWRVPLPECPRATRAAVTAALDAVAAARRTTYRVTDVTYLM